MVDVLVNMGAHFLGGIAVAGLDYIRCRTRDNVESRVEDMKTCLLYIEQIVDASKPLPAAIPTDGKTAGEKNSLESKLNASSAISKDSLKYAENVEYVKDYLIRQGLLKQEVKFGKKVKNFFKNFGYEEKINNLSWKPKLAFATALELGDTVLGLGLHVITDSPIPAIGYNVWQIPSFFAGLYVGKYLTKAIDTIVKSGDERKLGKAIKKAIRATDVIDYVVNYHPPIQVKEQMDRKGISYVSNKLTGAGKDAYQKSKEAIARGASYVPQMINQYREQKKQEEEAEKQAVKDRFDEITKGR